MKKVVFVLIGILCAVNVFARVPSVAEARNHISGASAVRHADELQAEASWNGLYDRYTVKLTGIPSAAIPVYDDYNEVSETWINDACKGDALSVYSRSYYVCFNIVKCDFKREKNYISDYDDFFKYGGFDALVKYYVSAHTTVYNELRCYKYPFKYTIYVTKGSTGQTSVYGTYSEDIYYNPYDGSWKNYPFKNKKREESMERTKNYIMELYSAKEFMTILGIKDGFARIIANKKSSSEKQDIMAVLCQGITGSGPILPHNPSIEDKYNKAMFGDISAQIKNLPSSSIKPAVYKGGEQAFASYLRNNIKYPEALFKDGYDENCVYTLTIGVDGSVKRVRSDCNNLNEIVKYQTVQLLMNLPYKFTPANGYGQNVESEYTVNMNYHIDPLLSIDESSLYFYSEGGEKVVRVSTKESWTYTAPKQSGVKARKEGNQLIITCDQRKKQDYDPLDDKVYVSVVGKNFQYEISIRQDGAPKPYIRPSQTKVYLPSNKKVARAVVTVDSNREWKVIHHNPETKIDAHKVDNRIVFTAPTNSKKYGKDATITLNSLDNDCQTNILVHQYSKKEEKENGLDSNGRERSSSNSGLGLWYNYYDKYGSFELGLLSVQAGFGCTLPLFADDAGMKTLVTQPYFPMNFELGTLRFHFIELSLLNLRLDLSLDGLDGIAWEPQVRALFPVSDRWALMPYVGPVWQIDTQQMENSVWSASGGLIARVRYGHATHTDLSIGYRGGPLGGIAIGVSIGWSLGW